MASKLKSQTDMQMDVLPAGCDDSRPSKCTAQIHESQAKAEHLTLKVKLEAKCSVLKYRSRRPSTRPSTNITALRAVT